MRRAAELGAPGPLLERLFRDAVHAGRKVRSQTAISESPASISSAAAALAQQVFGDLAGRKILVIGAGKISEQAARNLVSRGAAISAVANRSLERAEELAGRFGARSVSLDQAQEELTEADVVVSSTSAGGFVLEQAGVQATLGARRGRPLFLIDLAVPRDLDPAIHELPGCYLYDIDDLQAVVAESLAGRRSEAARAEEIVAAEAERFRAWQVVPRRRPRDRVPARPGGGDPLERARARPIERAVGAGSAGRRVAHRSDRQQAASPADRADEGGGGRC